MKRTIRGVVPQASINKLWHLPRAVIANARHGFPARKLKIIGVTGTDGKTTTANMIYQILAVAGHKSALISTINAVIGDQVLDTGFHVTSPSPEALQHYIAKAKQANCEFLVLEVTSHALDQYRVWGVPFEVGVVTNITHEHLDYHKTFESYRQAKSKLIAGAKIAVINRDDQSFHYLKSRAKDRVVEFGRDDNVKTNLPGEFNSLNAAAALAATTAVGVESDLAKKVLLKMPVVAGRMEEVPNNRGIKVVVDFAHTPNALEVALKSLRKITKGELIAVFGSAGYRDVEKRFLMGQVAAKFADKMIITAEDPRGQLPQINAKILAGAQSAGGKLGETIWIEGDRQKAISMAIMMAKKGDTVGIFGKGHEQSLNLDGVTEMPWSDLKAAQQALKNGQRSDK